MEAKGLARVLQARDDPREPHRGWSMIPHNSVVFRDSSEVGLIKQGHRAVSCLSNRKVQAARRTDLNPDLYLSKISSPKCKVRETSTHVLTF